MLLDEDSRFVAEPKEVQVVGLASCLSRLSPEDVEVIYVERIGTGDKSFRHSASRTVFGAIGVFSFNSSLAHFLLSLHNLSISTSSANIFSTYFCHLSKSFLHLRHKNCLVVGSSGRSARRRLRSLLIILDKTVLPSVLTKYQLRLLKTTLPHKAQNTWHSFDIIYRIKSPSVISPNTKWHAWPPL